MTDNNDTRPNPPTATPVPLPAPRHGLPVPALPARGMDAPTDDVDPRDLALIADLRRDVRRLDFDPLTDDEVAEQVARWPSAAASTAIEGNPLTPADVALAHMLFEERVPAGAGVPILARFARESRTA